MSWSFVIPGQPPSWNKSYHIVTQYRRRRDGGNQGYSTLAKVQTVIDYQNRAIPLIRSARPSHWAPEGQIRVIWDIYLGHDVDCDNLMKCVHDAIETATNINDGRFLPCARSKTIGVSPREARIEITIVDEPSQIIILL